MHILLINKALVFGGIETIMLTQYKAFKQLGYCVDIVLYSKKVELQLESFEDIYFVEEYKSLADFVYQRERDAGEYTLIVSHPPSATIVNDVRKLQRKESLFVLHGLYSVKLQNGNFISRYLRKKRLQQRYKDQNIVAVSNAVKNDFLHSVEVKPAYITTIYNPFDLSLIEQKAALKLQLPTQRDYIVWVGRIQSVKNLPLLLEIYSYLVDRFDLIIVGDGERSIKEQMQHYIEQKKLNKNVFFVGTTMNPYPYIKRAKALVLTSFNEGLPTVFIESLILKTPIFGVDITPNRELLEQFFKEGILVGTPQEMAQTILKYRENSIAYAEVAKRFNSQRCVKEYLSFIQKIT